MPKLKNGISTTEFWATVAAGLLSVGMYAAGAIDATWSASIVGALTAVYVVVRGWTKSSGNAS